MKTHMIKQERFPISFFTPNRQNVHRMIPVLEINLHGPIQPHEVNTVTTPEWMRYDYEHIPSQAYKALSFDAIMALDTLVWTRPTHTNLVRMQSH